MRQSLAMSFEDQLKIDYCLQFVGRPYIWGGDDPMRGFDCSGFAQEFLQAFGCELDYDHTSNALFHWQVREKHPQKEKPGALIYYGSIERITHVAVYLSAGFVFEFAGGGSKTRTRQDAIDHNAFGRVRPMYHRNDFRGCFYPFSR